MNKYKKINYLSKSKNVNIIARSMNKDNINGMENYWYYCTGFINLRDGEKGSNEWIFGGLFEY